MVSRENRVILGSFLLLVVAAAAITATEQWLDLRYGDNPFLAFLLFAGLAVAVPQLYLARTDTDVDPRSRVRFAVIATMVFAAMFAESTDELQSQLILAIAGGAFLVLVAAEFVLGYRGSATDGARDSSDR
ncbi:hypothetical protein [Natronorubrum tibetense]|uniref:Uncharacterized protein n=1 Tax=Natronorubrum tibetense GA33 TaxID=1114856 RepID=L9W069_9EURY|nr:hypothetical protein [Natronorubrum tibetense]ELY42717.1 hypothetical protein C496_05252 [Natronorubrum tibetense GA33]